MPMPHMPMPCPPVAYGTLGSTFGSSSSPSSLIGPARGEDTIEMPVGLRARMNPAPGRAGLLNLGVTTPSLSGAEELSISGEKAERIARTWAGQGLGFEVKGLVLLSFSGQGARFQGPGFQRATPKFPHTWSN